MHDILHPVQYALEFTQHRACSAYMSQKHMIPSFRLKLHVAMPWYVMFVILFVLCHSHFYVNVTVHLSFLSHIIRIICYGCVVKAENIKHENSIGCFMLCFLFSFFWVVSWDLTYNCLTWDLFYDLTSVPSTSLADIYIEIKWTITMTILKDRMMHIRYHLKLMFPRYPFVHPYAFWYAESKWMIITCKTWTFLHFDV